MSVHRYAPKRDASEREIIDAFEAGGAVVAQLSGLGVPDLVVGYRQRNHLIEAKSGNETLNAAQVNWHDTWSTGGGERPEVIRNAAQARKLLRIWDLEQVVRPSLDDDSDRLRNSVNPSKCDGEPA